MSLARLALAFVLLGPAAALPQDALEPGLVGAYYSFEQPLADFPALAPGAKPFLVRRDPEIDFPAAAAEFHDSGLADNFFVRWTGVLRVKAAGRHAFFTESDDGSRLWIGEKLVVDNGGTHPPLEKSGEIELAAGDHPFRVDFFEGGGGAACRASWQPPGQAKAVIPAQAFFHPKGVAFSPPAARPKVPLRWERMDYGRFLCASITAPFPKAASRLTRGNTAMKGIAIRLGGDDEAAVCFDADLLRFSAGWTGGFLRLLGTPFDGSHDTWPQIRGAQKWGTRPGPGWAKGADFKDPRPEPFGPLPADWAKYRGLFVHGDQVVLSYTVGTSEILEKPGLIHGDGALAFTRTFRAGPTPGPLAALLAETDDGTGRVEDGIARIESGETITAAALIGPPPGAALEVAGTRIHLQLPALAGPAGFGAALWSGPRADFPKFAALLKVPPAESVRSLTVGGPARWPEPVVTAGTLGTETGPYAVDTLAAPDENPWRSWMRFAGFDFFEDGTRAALSTWSGDVWIVSGIDATLQKLTWKRFASGLFQPLGLKIVDGLVHTLGRDQITRLRDLNGDGEADHYENFNNDVIMTMGFHEFAFDLQTDPEGNFYFVKGAPVNPGGGGFQHITPHHGCVFKVSKDGKKLEVFATGLRAPNGMSVGPNGEITTGDNEGTWTPRCRLNLVKKGGFYGVVDAAHRKEKPVDYDRPICWLPKDVDNSSGGQVWVTSGAWGPFKGHLLHLSYGTCRLYKVLWERSGDEVQGGVVRFPLDFQSGVMRARFNPKDGQLYLCGLRGWQSTAARDTAFHRVRYTGKPVHLPSELRVVKNGLEITFPQPLDPETAADAGNYSAEQWNYRWTSGYGSDEWSASNPQKKGRDPVAIAAARLSNNGRTVTLEIPDLKPVMQMRIRMRIKAADGSPVAHDLFNTINRVP